MKTVALLAVLAGAALPAAAHDLDVASATMVVSRED